MAFPWGAGTAAGTAAGAARWHARATTLCQRRPPRGPTHSRKTRKGGEQRMAKRRQGVSKHAANSAKAKRAVPKNGPVWYRSAEEATLDQMPKFNGFRCGTGAHGDTKYNRAKAKRTWQQQLRQEGTRDCGSLPFSRGGMIANLHNRVLPKSVRFHFRTLSICKSVRNSPEGSFGFDEGSLSTGWLGRKHPQKDPSPIAPPTAPRPDALQSGRTRCTRTGCRRPDTCSTR